MFFFTIYAIVCIAGVLSLSLYVLYMHSWLYFIIFYTELFKPHRTGINELSVHLIDRLGLKQKALGHKTNRRNSFIMFLCIYTKQNHSLQIGSNTHFFKRHFFL